MYIVQCRLLIEIDYHGEKGTTGYGFKDRN